MSYRAVPLVVVDANRKAHCLLIAVIAVGRYLYIIIQVLLFDDKTLEDRKRKRGLRFYSTREAHPRCSCQSQLSVLRPPASFAGDTSGRNIGGIKS